MYKVEKHQKHLDQWPKEMRMQYILIKRASKGFTIQNAEARRLDDLLTEKIEKKFLGKKSSGTKPRAEDKKPMAADKDAAHKLAMDFLRPYVSRGDRIESLNNMGGGDNQNFVEIERQKVRVTKLDGQITNFKFDVKQLYDQLRKESGQTSNNSKVGEGAAFNRVYRYLEPYVGQDYAIKDIQELAKISNPEITFQIRGDYIYVTKLEGDKVNFRFGLHALFVRIREDLEMEPVDLSESEKSSKKAKKDKPDAKTVRHEHQTATDQPTYPPASQTISPQMVERLSEEVRIIKRYVLMEGKIKTPEQILSFANYVRKAIFEKRIRKSSPYAEQIIYIQDRLITRCNTVKVQKKVTINTEVLQEFRDIVSTEKILLSAVYFKRYMNIEGRKLDKQKALRLADLIQKALDKNKIAGTDPYRNQLENALKLLREFINSAKGRETLQMHPNALNGIKTALDGCACEEEDLGCLGKNVGVHAGALAPHVPQKVISSIEFENFEIQTLGLFGKWYDLIGDPTKGFIVMIFGKPKLGKTYLAVDLAGFLAFYFGPVLYVTREEGFSGTFQQKVIEMRVAHPELYIASEIPEDLTPYEFVFFDSATKLNLVPEDIACYKQLYPGKTFIYVFQATKDGNFRGSQEFEHDVDVIIEVYDLGKARQYGRFNQGAEMDIFEQAETVLPLAA